MELRKANFIILIFFALITTIYAENSVNINLDINDSVMNKTKNEIAKNIENKTFSIFKDVKEIKYKYYIFDESKKYDAYKAEPHDVDVAIISTHENSSIALAYQPRNFIIYDGVHLKIYNKNKANLSLNLILNDNIIKNYSICDEYNLFKLEFADNVKKLRIQVMQKNETIFDTGTLTIIHQNYVQWYENNKKDTVSVEKGYLILSNIWYMLSGGILTLALCVLIAKQLKKKKEKQIISGWGL